MLKLRLKRIGRKGSPSYRLVVMKTTSPRDGKPVDEVGYYNPISKNYEFDYEKIVKWLSSGVKPTETVLSLLKCWLLSESSGNNKKQMAKAAAAGAERDLLRHLEESGPDWRDWLENVDPFKPKKLNINQKIKLNKIIPLC